MNSSINDSRRAITQAAQSFACESCSAVSALEGAGGLNQRVGVGFGLAAVFVARRRVAAQRKV